MKEDETTGDGSKDEAILDVYEDGSEFIYSTTESLEETVEKSIQVRFYCWLIKYTVCSDAESTVVQLFVDFKSRYSFADKTALEVTVVAVNTTLSETFDIEKENNQSFVVDLTKYGLCGVDKEDISVICTVSVTGIEYCTETIGTNAIFTACTRPHDVVLLLGEEKFYVHKLYLATWSKYFNTLFYGDFAERHQNEVKLEDVGSSEFATLLRIIHPNMHTKINDSNVLYLLKLADRFLMPSVLAMCGNHLMDFKFVACRLQCVLRQLIRGEHNSLIRLDIIENCRSLSIMERLELSDKYNLVHLQVACLSTIHKRLAPEFATFLENNRHKIRKLSFKTVQNLIYQ